MADAKITEQSDGDVALSDTDVSIFVDDVGGTPVTKKYSMAGLKAFLKTYFDTLYTAIGGYGNREVLTIALSDETTDITTGTKIAFHMPYAFKLQKVKVGLTTASSSGTPTFDFKDDGVSVFTTRPTIDVNELFSDTAAVPSVLTSTPLTIASGSLMTVDIDVAGTGAKGAKIYLIGYSDGAA